MSAWEAATPAGRLRKLLLMLSSDQPGEVVAAAALIGHALHSAGGTWHDLAERLTSGGGRHEPAHCRTDGNQNVEVVDFRRTSAGNVRAFASVRIGQLTLRNLKVVQQPGQQPWVSLPAVRGKDGRWQPIAAASPELKELINSAVLAAWQAGGGQ